MPHKSKADELYERIIKGEIDGYFNSFNAEDFKVLLTALADDDVDAMVEVLAKNLKASKSGFETVLFAGTYDAEVRELANRIFSRERKKREAEKIERIILEQPRARPVFFPPRETRLAQRFKKPIKVKASPRQKEYRKTQPKEFTPREIKFLQARVSMTGGQVFREYLNTFGNVRTNRSVKTKFFRVR